QTSPRPPSSGGPTSMPSPTTGPQRSTVGAGSTGRPSGTVAVTSSATIPPNPSGRRRRRESFP
ncbi:unnamed protein product, partial [Rotaria sp. Silwood1]